MLDSRGSSSQIYIVDDDEAVRDGLRALFEANGFAVQVFASSETFLAVHDPTMGGCLLLDVSLPGVSGLGALKLMAASGSRVPVIVMTARTDEEIGLRAIEAGAAGFLAKPLQSGQLMSFVKRALDTQRTRA